MTTTKIEKDHPLLMNRIREIVRNGNLVDISTDIMKLFDWHKTKEGHSFWMWINIDHINEAKKLQPHLFETKN